jgi:signal recognition particle GTPase
VSEVNRLLKDFDQARTLMKRLNARRPGHGGMREDFDSATSGANRCREW